MQAAAQGGGCGRPCAPAISFPCATDGWAGKGGGGGSAAPMLSSWHCRHLHDTRSSEHRCCVFLGGERGWSKGWLASCPCPRRIVTECCWIRSREVTLRVWLSGTGFEPDLMIKCDIIPAFRLTQLTGMPLRFPLFGGVKHFCCKPSKRRYCLRVEQKRLWKICQESACALLVPKHGRA